MVHPLFSGSAFVVSICVCVPEPDGKRGVSESDGMGAAKAGCVF